MIQQLDRYRTPPDWHPGASRKAGRAPRARLARPDHGPAKSRPVIPRLVLATVRRSFDSLAEQCNFGLSLDADHRLTPAFQAELAQLIAVEGRANWGTSPRNPLALNDGTA
jgi:hypothetical protein